MTRSRTDVDPGPDGAGPVAESSSGLPSSERIYRALREQILAASLPPCSRLVEEQLAARFRVSRTPVREALKRLVVEGLLVHDPLRGLVVRDFDPREADELGELREMMEGYAARLAARRASPEQ